VAVAEAAAVALVAVRRPAAPKARELAATIQAEGWAVARPRLNSA